MFKIDGNKTMHITRGDVGYLTINFNNSSSSSSYVLGPGSVVRLSVYQENDLSSLIFNKDVTASETTNTIQLVISPNDTRDNIEATNSPLKFWYEIELNPNENNSQTVVGYDLNGPKLFMVYPEGTGVSTS